MVYGHLVCFVVIWYNFSHFGINLATPLKLIFWSPHEAPFCCSERPPFRVGLSTRVARWYIFKPKIPILVYLGGPWSENFTYFCGHWEYLTAIWNILLPFGTFCGYLTWFFTILVCFRSKNLADLLSTVSKPRLRPLICRPIIANLFLNRPRLTWTPFLHFSSFFLLHRRPRSRVTRGRCCDHNFLRIFLIFGEKMAFFLNTNVIINFYSKFSFVLSQKRQFFRKIFRRKYLKNHNIGPRWVCEKFAQSVAQYIFCQN
jgi:hypothetical protein